MLNTPMQNNHYLYHCQHVNVKYKFILEIRPNSLWPHSAKQPLATFGQTAFGHIRPNSLWPHSAKQPLATFSQTAFGHIRPNSLWPHSVKQPLATFGQTAFGHIQSNSLWPQSTWHIYCLPNHGIWIEFKVQQSLLYQICIRVC